ncbi:hypothetical protein Glo7428_2124 [Gloeocapsa sp. PCC 7428]|uniref:hypothetical protein n=1 Tax=Gloeocapsa sp. PCC 7428 TaxID=1173026 RepID=UPI0002A5DFB9|nr:hypothetical protein [Gloeocapsa sp. PCC 7428]AFZ30652.1 hypothetical protein Glo7428_2124 [Gloeocapsa sp. PCC 7428]
MNRINQLYLRRKVGIWGSIFGGLLIGIPAIPLAASAQSSVLNPCPRIYYEEPFNSRNFVPQGCPPNAFTQQYGASSATPNRIIVNQQPSDTVAGQNPPGLPGSDLTPNRIVPADAPTTPGEVVPTPGQPGVAVRGVTPGVTNPPGTPQTLPVQPPLPEERSEPVALLKPTGQQVSVRLKNNTNALVTYEVTGHTGRRYLPGGEEATLQNVPLPATITVVRQDDGFVKILPVTTDAEPGLLAVSLDEDATPLDDNQGVIRIQSDGQVFVN